jgi:hypothetical protein
MTTKNRIQTSRDITVVILNEDPQVMISDLKYLGDLLTELGVTWEQLPLVEINGNIVDYGDNDTLLPTEPFEIMFDDNPMGNV